MSQSLISSGFATQRAPLQIFRPFAPVSHSARWKINGHKASLLIWSAEEWERLDQRPADAQFHPHGVWCALRFD
jgi:hypothetical protein